MSIRPKRYAAAMRELAAADALRDLRHQHTVPEKDWRIEQAALQNEIDRLRAALRAVVFSRDHAEAERIACNAIDYFPWETDNE